jgi:hypothetical protein
MRALQLLLQRLHCLSMAVPLLLQLLHLLQQPLMRSSSNLVIARNRGCQLLLQLLYSRLTLLHPLLHLLQLRCCCVTLSCCGCQLLLQLPQLHLLLLQLCYLLLQLMLCLCKAGLQGPCLSNCCILGSCSGSKT